MGSIYLIRHGQASFGADDYDVLSPVGIRQAQVLGTHLVDLGLTFDRCLSGKLLRQQDTARHALAQYAEAGHDIPVIETDSAFDEFDAEGVIRALIPAMLAEEPEALNILRNAAEDSAGFQRLFTLI
ncbi:histidine phosphatase family protein, partial [Pseudomonas syringae]